MSDVAKEFDPKRYVTSDPKEVRDEAKWLAEFTTTNYYLSHLESEWTPDDERRITFVMRPQPE